ncbi:MAG: L,D-transpeptidase family protein [Haliea sp.]|uniref:L,D-transpeptidase family protein n=1 Tax=Haliea sp. TaxID=1932666 RepID=UPI0032EDC5F3
MQNNRLTHSRADGQQILAICALLLCCAMNAAIAATEPPATPTALRSHLAQVLATHPDPPVGGSLTVAELAAFYAARDYRPLWNEAAASTAWERALAGLAADGLDPDRYLAPATGFSAGRQFCRELAMTAAWLQAQLDLRFGALDRQTIEPLWRQRPTSLAGARRSLLGSAPAFAREPATAIALARPELPVYRALGEALVALPGRENAAPWQQLPDGRLLRPGQSDPRVPLLRARLRAENFLPAAGSGVDQLRYDRELALAVEAFQHRHLLAVDGIVGPATLAALNQTHAQRRAQLEANLERWRWLQHEQLPHQIVVDIAAANIAYYRDNQLQWHARATVGRSLRQTPSLRSAVSHFTLNPSWTVPPTIFREDKLPAIRANPEYLQEQNLRVLDAQGSQLDPETIDWQRPGAIILRQLPGPDNPLGRIAIRFPNPFSVYLHDTPGKQLFARAQRTDSSGCVRVEDVMTLAEEMLRSNRQYDPAAVASRLASGTTSDLPLLAPVPLLMDYWTADLDARGTLVLRPDIYGRDAALAAALSRRPATSPPLPPACNGP